MAEKILFVTALTDYSSKDLEGVGTLRKDSDGKVYRWVKNGASAAAFIAGRPVCFDIALGTGSLTTIQSTVLHPSDTNLGMLAGIAMSAIPAGYFGWVMKEGFYADAKCVVGTDLNIAVGGALMCQTGSEATTAASAGCFKLGVALGTAPVYPGYAIALEADTATSAALLRSLNVFVRAI